MASYSYTAMFAPRLLSRETSTSTSRASEDDDDLPKYTKLTINTSYDIYDATVVAAFGGVRIGTGSNGTDPEPLHAFFMFIPSLLLYLLQGSLMASLSLDLDLKADVRPRPLDELCARERILIWIKISVYMIVQLQLFASILGTLNLLVFILTPSTWDLEKMKRPDPKTMHSNFWFTFQRSLVMPWPVISLLMKLTIDYSVCVTSLSVILMAEDAVQCLFNSLAIAWISELDGLVWHVISTVAMLDRATFQNFRFERTGDDTSKKKRKPCSTLCGAKFLTNVALLLMYWRQSLIVHMAIDTNILPAARDVCTAWRLIEGPHAIPLLNTLLNLIPAWNQVIRDALVQNADPEHGGLCDGDYYPTSLGDMVELSANHADVGLLMVVLTLFLFSPYLLSLVSDRFGTPHEIEKGEIFATEEELDIRTLHKALTDQRLEHQEQSKLLMESHREIAELRESIKTLDYTAKFSSAGFASPPSVPTSLTSSRADFQVLATHAAGIISRAPEMIPVSPQLSPRAYHTNGEIVAGAPRVLQSSSYASAALQTLQDLPSARLLRAYESVPHVETGRPANNSGLSFRLPFG